MMRKLTHFIATGALLLGILFPAPALAATNVFGNVCAKNGAKESAVCQTQQKDNPLTGSNGLIVKITRVVAIVAGITAVIIIMLAGLRYITSSGDATQAAQARKGIIYALVGLIVIIVAQFIISFVISRI
jgi:hypothetical protein